VPLAYGFGELDTLVPAYAATIHKSKARVPAVVIPVSDPALHHAAAEFSYTGVTRARSWSCWSARRKPSDRSAQHLGKAAVVELHECWQILKGNQILASDSKLAIGPPVSGPHRNLNSIYGAGALRTLHQLHAFGVSSAKAGIWRIRFQPFGRIWWA